MTIVGGNEICRIQSNFARSNVATGAGIAIMEGASVKLIGVQIIENIVDGVGVCLNSLVDSK